MNRVILGSIFFLQAFCIFIACAIYLFWPVIVLDFSGLGRWFAAAFPLICLYLFAILSCGGLHPEKRLVKVETLREAYGALWDLRQLLFYRPLIGVWYMIKSPKRLQEAEQIFADRVESLLFLEFLDGFENEDLPQTMQRLERILAADAVIVRADGEYQDVIQALSERCTKDFRRLIQNRLVCLIARKGCDIRQFMLFIELLSSVPMLDGVQRHYLRGIIFPAGKCVEWIDALRQAVDDLVRSMQGECNNDMLRQCVAEVLKIYRHIPDCPVIDDNSFAAYKAAYNATEREV